MEKNNPTPSGINYREVWRRIWSRRQLFYKVLPITFILSALYIVSLPRYYRTEAMLAPETENGLAAGAFGSIASTFGIDLAEEGSDAITPMLYPDLLHQKKAWWAGAFTWIKNLFASKDDEGEAGERLNPYALSKPEDGIVTKIRNSISLSVDKKTGVITVNVEDQDPKVCKTICDSMIMRLQGFITDYRTNKARRDVSYYASLSDSALAEYKNAVREFNRFADANINVTLPSYRTRQSDLENEMQLRYNAYTVLNTQLQNAKAKVQERTPAFTLLKGAATPLLPAGPKRMFFVAFMLFLAFCITGCYVLKDILLPDAPSDKAGEKA